MDRGSLALADSALVEECRDRSVELLRRNLVPAGILAASRTPRAISRGYCAVFGRDASICAIGMALSGDATLRRGALDSLATLARHQAANGQIPNIVGPRGGRPDFWYVGCIDATLWWLIALGILDRLRPGRVLQRRFAPAARRALRWLQCQEHPHFRLLQQNEASDWADIMPRSGYVLYTNALWHYVKRQYGLEGAQETRDNAELLLRPAAGARSGDRRTRILAAYARAGAPQHGLFLSYLNLAACGREGDAFGNALAVLCGLAEGEGAARILRALDRAAVGEPYPMRVVCRPVARGSREWRPYMNRHRQNRAWEYHNGGIWPFAGALWTTALAEAGLREAARVRLAGLARANARDDWSFHEWLHGRSGRPGGMQGQSWNAATFLIAHHVVVGGKPVFRPSADAQNGTW